MEVSICGRKRTALVNLEIFLGGNRVFGDELDNFHRTSTNTMASFNPTQIFDDGTTEEKGENARLSAFVGAIAVGDLGMGSFHLIFNQQLTRGSKINFGS